MYKCDRCRSLFEYPDTALDFTSEYFGRTVNHYTIVCPDCGSDDIGHAYKCWICGQYHADDSEYCQDCVKLADDLVSSFRETIKEQAISNGLNYDELYTYIAENM